MKTIVQRFWVRIKGLFKKQRSVEAAALPASKGVAIYNLIQVTAGGRHGWFNSSVGPIRKPL
jgi:hypothetical protein